MMLDAELALHCQSTLNDSVPLTGTVIVEIVEESEYVAAVAGVLLFVQNIWSEHVHVVPVLKSTSPRILIGTLVNVPTSAGELAGAVERSDVNKVPAVPPQRTSQMYVGGLVAVLIPPLSANRYAAPPTGSLAGTDSEPREVCWVVFATVTADVAAG